MRLLYRIYPFLVLSAIIAWSPPATYAQPGWSWINPTLPDGQLHAVCFSDPSNGTAVGEGGVILHTTDDGMNWTVQVSGTTVPLWAVSFGDRWHGTAVGGNGTFLHTTDAGKTWTSVAGTNSNWYLRGVTFTDALHGTVVGSFGTLPLVLRTTNGGATWVQQTTPLGYTDNTVSELSAVFFVDANIGTAVSMRGEIIRTTDGGTNWIQQAGATGLYLRAIYFTDANTGTVVGAHGTIFRTTNGGTTWDYQSILTTDDLSGISFLDDKTGTVVGGKSIYHTTNGGATWILQPHSGSGSIEGVVLTSPTTGTVVGGAMLHTADNGASWVNLTGAKGFASLKRVCFPDANNGIAVGDLGTVVRTSDGGANWTRSETNEGDPLNGVSFADATHGTVVGGMTWFSGQYGNQTDVLILHTTDGGMSWNRQTSPTKNIFSGVFFSDVNTGTAVGDNGAIIHTTNGGGTWTLQQSPVIATVLQDVIFTDANTGTAVGTNGVIIHTTNGGAIWTQQPSGTIHHLYGVSFPNAMNGTAVGYLGTIVRTTDGGFTWQVQASPASNDLYSVSFPNPDTGTAVGANGTIVHTTNGGRAWTIQPSGAAAGYTGVAFTSPNTGTVVGYGGVILRTVNGGLPIDTLKEELPPVVPTSKYPRLIQPLDGSTQVSKSPVLQWGQALDAVSYRVQIGLNSSFIDIISDSLGIKDTLLAPDFLRDSMAYYWHVCSLRSDGRSYWSPVWSFLTTDERPRIPTQFILYQNYPNPFNNTTVVRYDLPVASRVNVSVYDLLGRKVMTLIDGEVEAGLHYATFDGSGRATGMYICRLHAGPYVASRKMLLQK